jgi:hypothetical protein
MFQTQLEETVVEPPESYQLSDVGEAVPYVTPFPPLTVR